VLKGSLIRVLEAVPAAVVGAEVSQVGEEEALLRLQEAVAWLSERRVALLDGLVLCVLTACRTVYNKSIKRQPPSSRRQQHKPLAKPRASSLVDSLPQAVVQAKRQPPPSRRTPANSIKRQPPLSCRTSASINTSHRQHAWILTSSSLCTVLAST
jgi:hypothetical protein